MSHANVAKPPTSWSQLELVGQAPVPRGAMGLVGLGGVLALGSGEHGGRAMFSYLWAFEVMLSIALGGLGWVLIEHAVRSGWSTVLRRIGETSAATLPLFAILFVPIVTIGFTRSIPGLTSRRGARDQALVPQQRLLHHARDHLFVVWIALGAAFHRLSVKQIV